jgi:hypothetical protein
MTKRDLDQIAFVTKHFDRMRNGLAVAFLGPLLLIALAALRSPAWVYVALIAAGLLIGWVAERWTTRRLGRVVAAAEPRHAGWRWIGVLAGVALVRLWEIDNDSLGTGLPSFSLIWVGAVVLWVVIRDWPFRKYQVAIPVFAFTGAAAHMGVVTEADLLLWRMAAGGSVVVAAMAIGLLDYLTIVRIFGGARSPEPVDHADAV